MIKYLVIRNNGTLTRKTRTLPAYSSRILFRVTRIATINVSLARSRIAVIHPRLQFARTLRGGCYRYESQCIKHPFSLRAPRPVYCRRIFPGFTSYLNHEERERDRKRCARWDEALLHRAVIQLQSSRCDTRCIGGELKPISLTSLDRNNAAKRPHPLVKSTVHC